MLQSVTAITVYIPVESADLMHAEDVDALCAQSKTLSDILDLLEQSSPIGCLGDYGAAYEITFGMEGFTPLKGAQPTQGEIGKRESVRTICLKTFAPDTVTPHALETFLNAVIAIHPWEHPAIEVSRVQLVIGPRG